MTPAVRISAVLLAAVVVCPSASAAQSLADLAKQEEARRNSAPRSSRTLTNADLAPDANRGTPTREPVAAEPVAANVSPAAVATPAPPPKPALDEAYWRPRAAELRRQLAIAEEEVQSISGVTHDDPRKQARTQALLKKRQDKLTRAENAFHLFLMQADVAGVPKEWIQ